MNSLRFSFSVPLSGCKFTNGCMVAILQIQFVQNQFYFAQVENSEEM